ncbi:MAG: hypothetical protein COX51_06945 [Syntrophobacteraceae bacterium CG23_combo_of_CG06-09_8_20_14_all_50_8]|nr:MAG: hypothetical protein COX51_06945 [Syntrophobacteraceae bacterium CG23_combo_of_CG06-09_8_20_14_all_50_8]
MTNSTDIQRIFASFNGGGKASLPELSLALLEEQKAAWKDLREGYGGLASLKEHRIEEDEISVILQYNPKRIISAGANIDPVAIKARPCFLCRRNLPDAQKAVLYRRKFLILCNPAPIFPFHFTIAHIEHIPQLLSRALPSFLQLAKDFLPSFALLYNGPRCGASAPDHLHFQAIPKAAVPVLNDGRAGGKKVLRKETGGLRLFKMEGGGIPVIIVEGRSKAGVVAFVRRIIKAMKQVFSAPAEPMMNLFCLYNDGKWEVVMFSRGKHRPDVYFKSGKDRLLISPGAVDMGGIVIVTREEDFYHLDAAAVRGIIREVSLPDEKVEEIIAAL